MNRLGSIVMSMSVCGSVCLSVREDISGTTRTRDFYQFLCMLPVFVARSSSDTFTIGRIAYRQGRVFFHIEKALSAEKGDGSAQRGRSMLFALFKYCKVPKLTTISM